MELSKSPLLYFATIIVWNTAMGYELLEGNFIGNGRAYGGESINITSLVMMMESGEIGDGNYYSWTYTCTAILLSETCAILRASDIVDTTLPIPVLLTNVFRTLWIPRPGCDMQYHIRQIYLNQPGYNYASHEHDIALAKVQRPIYFGNKICGGAAIRRRWVSCDATGPPKSYRDCFFASYGLNSSYSGGGRIPTGPQFISPNKIKVKILSAVACEARRVWQNSGDYVFYYPKDQICMSTYDNFAPNCADDNNGVVFCKYWKSPQQGNGWGSNTNTNHHVQGQNSHGNGWKRNPKNATTGGSGWSQDNNWVIVGHVNYSYGQSACPGNSAALAIKFGSPTYRHLFLDCEFICSSELPSGYRCQGKPSPSLGPVYCIPEKIPGS